MLGGVSLVSSVQIGDMGSIVFPAAKALASWLEDQGELTGVKTVELGCGTGLVGLVACRLGARVVLTDLEIYLGQLQENIEANKDVLKGDVEAKSLDWEQEVGASLRGQADLLLVSDCVYYEQSLGPLVKTMISLTNSQSTVLLSYERRQEKIPLYQVFFQLVDEQFTREVLKESISEHGNPLYLMKLKRICNK